MENWLKFHICIVAAMALFALTGCNSGRTMSDPPTPIQNEWTWVAGSNAVNQSGSYGFLGTAASSNVPGARYSAVSWIDSAGTFWLFGGSGLASSEPVGFLNDLWKYSGGQWTWMNGSNATNQPGIYGTQGTAASGNQPGARADAAGWIDTAGNLWLFGGNIGGIGNNIAGSTPLYYNLNDMWKYSDGEWAWMGGAKTANQPGVYGTKGAASAVNVPGARSSAAHSIDASGNFWLFGGIGADYTGTQGELNDLWKYSSGQWTWMSGANTANQPGVYGTQGTASTANVPGARYQAVSWTDAAGNFWLFGGSGSDKNEPPSDFFNDLWKYSGGQWTWMGGANTANQPGVYGTQGTASTANVPGARYQAVSWTDAAGNFWLFGGYGIDSIGTLGMLNDLWKYSGGQWTWMGGANTANQPGVYGTQGMATASNIPGARESAVGWLDRSGKLWLLGGEDKNGGKLNDLWEYQP
jgi:N-acetylneuraminic acid mutarotase